MRSSSTSLSSTASSSIPFSSSTILLCRPTTDNVATMAQGHRQVMQMTSTQISNSSNPKLMSNPNNAINMHSDQYYQYLRTVLPPIPHVIEKLSFTDLNSWGCCLNLALLTSTDCLKWLAEFQDITKTDWKIEKSLAPHGNGTNEGGSSSVSSIGWGVIYRCNPAQSRKCNDMPSTSANNGSFKECTARLEMKIINQSSVKDQQPHKTNRQYPCTVNIHFYHNHKTLSSFSSSALTNSTSIASLPSSSTNLESQRSHQSSNPTLVAFSQNNVTNHHALNSNGNMVYHQDAVVHSSTSSSDNLTNSNSQMKPQLHHRHLVEKQQPQQQPSNPNPNAAMSNPNAATSSNQDVTTSYSHIQELKMNDAYMVNALAEAAAVTRATAVAAKSNSHCQNLQSSK